MSEPEDKAQGGDLDAKNDPVENDGHCVGDFEGVQVEGGLGVDDYDTFNYEGGFGEVIPSRDRVSEVASESLRATSILDAAENAKPFRLDEYGSAEKCLDGFFQNAAFPHAGAMNAIVDNLPRDVALSSLSVKDFDVEAFVARIPNKALFSTSRVSSGGEIDRQEMRFRMSEKVLSTWKGEGRAFLKIPGFGSGMDGFGVKTALKCPRFPGDDKKLTELGVSEEDKTNPVQALKYKVLFLKASHDAFEKDKDHRIPYMAAQLSTLIGKNVGARRSIPLSHEQRIFDVPSMAMFRKSKDVGNARVFITAMLSLLLPDKAKHGGGKDASLFDAEGNLTGDIVQEDFVLVDLMGLAKKMEIYEEFEQVFAAIFKLRHRSFVKRFHLKKGTKRRSLMDNLTAMKEYSGVPAKVFSLGHGDGVLERELLNPSEDPMVSEIVGVDLHDKADLGLVEKTQVGDRGSLTKVAKGKDDDRDRIKRVFSQFDGQADIGVAADSLHETENPFAYILQLYGQIKPGGFLYVTDPIHCEATDKMTSVTLNPFDNTRHASSMLSLEQYFEIIGYLTMKGAKIYDISITPGVYAGYNDALWRITLSIRKPDLRADDPEKRDSVPYKLPVENIDWGKEVDSSEDIFNVWPLSCVEPKDREKVLAMIEQNLGCKIEDFGMSEENDGTAVDSGVGTDEIVAPKKIKFGDAKPFVIRGLLGGGELAELRARDIMHVSSPYGAVLPRLFANLRNSPMNEEFVDRDLESFNHFAGEVLAIIFLLKSECGIDISAKVRKTHGWKDVDFRD